MGLWEPLEPRRMFATYYVSPVGDDNAPGTAAGTQVDVGVDELR